MFLMESINNLYIVYIHSPHYVVVHKPKAKKKDQNKLVFHLDRFICFGFFI